MKRKEIENKELDKTRIMDEIHRIELEDDVSGAKKEGNRKASIIIVKGRSKDPKYKWYPYWSVQLKGQEGSISTWTPTKDLMMNIVSEFFLHEERTDLTRDRRDELKVHEEKIKEILTSVQQKIKDFEIPEAYKRQRKQ